LAAYAACFDYLWIRDEGIRIRSWEFKLEFVGEIEDGIDTGARASLV